MGENLAIVQGKLGQDPDLRYTPGGTAVCKFSLAVNKKYLDKQGNKQEKVYWAKIVAWGKLAEICGKHLSKGQECIIRGELGLNEYMKDGVKVSFTEITADRMNFCGSSAPKAREEEEDIPF